MKKSLRVLNKKHVDKWVNDMAKRVSVGLKQGTAHYYANPFSADHIPKQIVTSTSNAAIMYNDGRGLAQVEVAMRDTSDGYYLVFTETWWVKI